MSDYELFSDGACQPNPGHGGWAFLLRNCSLPGDEVISSGQEPNTTNNRMELKAILEGLIYFNSNIKPGSNLAISLDSAYVLNGMQSWCRKWQRNNWIKSDKKPVLNMDMWQQIIDQVDKIPTIEYNLIKGHSGHIENEICDRAAVNEIKKAKDSIS